MRFSFSYNLISLRVESVILIILFSGKAPKRSPASNDGVLLTIIKPKAFTKPKALIRPRPDQEDGGVIYDIDVLKSRLQKEPPELYNLENANVEELLKVYRGKSFKETELNRCRLRVRVFLNDRLFGEDTSEVI